MKEETEMDYVFLTDIDGTLLRRDAPLTQQVISAARSFTAHGGLLSVCTGRSLPAVEGVAEAIGVNAPSIIYGGAAIYDFQEKKYLYRRPFQWDVMQGVRAVLEADETISVQVFTTERAFVLRRNRRLNERGVVEENRGPLSDPDEVSGDILKLVFCCDEHDRLEACRQYFPGEYCNYAFAARTFVDVVPAGLGKKEAMQRLSELLGVPFNRFFAAGDAITDLPLLEAVGVGFAPENAMPEVKACVDHIVPDVSQGGMAEAFRMAEETLR